MTAPTGVSTPATAVRRAIPGAPSSVTYQQITSTLAFQVATVPLTALGAGGTQPLTAYDQGGKPMPVPAGVTYSSSDESVMMVNAVTGAITAVAVGTAILIAVYGSARRALATVTITQVPHMVGLDSPGATIPLDGGTDRRAAHVATDTTAATIPLGATDQRAAHVAVSPTTVTLS